MNNPTRTYLLIEERLDTDLLGFVERKRIDGASWNRIAVELNELTKVLVTSETLRIWFCQQDEKVAG